MVRAGFLKPLLDVDRQGAAIADENRGRNRRAFAVQRPDVAKQRCSGARANARGRLLPPPASRDDVDERGALDRADQRDAAARQRSFLIGDALR